MAQPPPIIRTEYPFLRIRFSVRAHESDEVLALLDTGFTGHLAIPSTVFNGPLGLPDTRIDWELGDPSVVDSPPYWGTVETIGLSPVPATIAILGNE